MLDRINIIKEKFEMIKTILDDSLTLEDLSHPKYLKILINASEHTYIQLNDSICDNLYMCQECASKRDTLNHYIQLFDNIELGHTVSDNMKKELEQYPKIIEELINKINVFIQKM